MSATESDEKWADWCATGGDLSMCGTRMKEYSRRSEGIRWCFHCRTRHEFERVMTVPDGMSYYGPSISIQGPKVDCTDLFPGSYWVWDED